MTLNQFLVGVHLGTALPRSNFRISICCHGRFPNIGLQGFAPKFAGGEIAALSGAGDDSRYFQISVPVQPRNSGGALVDERGNVVGMVSAKVLADAHHAKAAFLSSGALPVNVNYAVKGRADAAASP